jgi:hypothetical protein
MAHSFRPIIGWRTAGPRAASRAVLRGVLHRVRPDTAIRDWLKLHSPGTNENKKKIKIE